VDFSHFQYVLGRPRKNKWCQRRHRAAPDGQEKGRAAKASRAVEGIARGDGAASELMRPL